MNKGLLILISLIVLVLIGYFIPKGDYIVNVPSKVDSDLSLINLPEGFQIEYYVKNIDGARSLELSESGILFVGTRQQGKVYAVMPDKEIITIASGLKLPNGVALRNGSLYVAEVNQILIFDDIENNLRNASSRVIYDKLPSDLHHGWKFIRFGPDGKLYVPVGAPCNLCLKEEPYASITRMNPDGSDFEIYAAGVRNTVGFDWHPITGDLWFTDNGRDLMGENIPPDELNLASSIGMHFGFPYCHGTDTQDDKFTSRNCDEFSPNAVELGPHVAALGMRFYIGEMFPSEYKNQIFIAEHGSWNRKVPIGYRITLVKDGAYEVFADGWLQGDKAWGRPVDIEHMPDGSLLVSDDRADAVYRIFYST